MMSESMAMLSSLTVVTVALTALTLVCATAGLLLTAAGSASRARVLGHPLVVLVGAATVVGVAALGQWAVTHAVLGAGFSPTDDGWRRIASAHVDVELAIAAVASLQRTAAICVAVMIPCAWIAAWRFDPTRERSATVAAVAGTFALTLPVLAGCGGVLWMADTMLTVRSEAAIWPAWHALEASKWAVAGIAAVGLMAATPVVVHAASRGHVVSARSSQLAQVMLLVGLAAWSTSRFASEDLVRGPMTTLERGDGAWHQRTDSQGLRPLSSTILQPPTASQCATERVAPETQRVLWVELDTYGSPNGTRDWPRTPEEAGPNPVLVATIDRRASRAIYEPVLLRAQRLGVQRIAIVTTLDDVEPSLTLGSLHSQSPCVLGWIGMDHALRLSSAGSRWTTLAYAASHQD